MAGVPDISGIAGRVMAALAASPGNGTVLAYVHSREAAEVYKELLTALSAAGVRPVVMSPDEGLLKKESIEGSVVTLESRRWADAIAGFLDRFTESYRTWYIVDGCDPTVADGYSIGYIYEQEAFGIFRNAALRLENLRDCVDRARPGVVVTFFPEEAAGLGGFLSGGDGLGQGTAHINVPVRKKTGRLKVMELSLRLGFPGWAYRFATDLMKSVKAGTRYRNQAGTVGQYLFFYAGGTVSSLDSISGVAGAVRGRGVINLAAGDKTKSELAKRGIDALTYGDIYGWYTPARVLIKRKPLMDNIKTLFERLTSSPSFDYNGVSLFPFVRDELERLLIKGLHNTLARTAALGRLTGITDVKALLIASSMHPEPREALLFCKSHGIPAAEVFHGMVSYKPIFGPFLADRIAVWGEGMREWFLEHGTDDKKLVTTGQPRYDGILEHLKNADTIKAELGIPAGKKVVMYAATGYEGETGTVGMALSAMRGREDAVFVIKPHPVEDPAIYDRLLRDMDFPCALVAKGKNIFDMLAICDTVLLTFSTVGLEAVLMGKLLVVLSSNRHWGGDNYIEQGVAVLAETAPEVRKAVDGLLDGSPEYGYLKDNRERFIHRYNYKHDGRARERVAAVLDELSGR
ncbi:MAG: CDP-glycerol glycerophosphotransferase family protein [Nitrospirae bacterium]|nr:CDP-glycerol glycerophosphotransferase family protein [Nitrospirota bacterium]